MQKGMLWRRRPVSRVKVGRRIVKVIRVDGAKSGCKVKAPLAVGKSQIQEFTFKQEAHAVMTTEFVAPTESADLFLKHGADAEVLRPTQSI